MDRFQAIAVFREVARQGGFAAAARSLGLSTPSVSRLVSELEDHVGVRRFSRSTRQVALTEEGELFLRRGVPLLDELESVLDETRERQTEVRGHLRISSVVAFGQEVVAPAVTGFLARHPNVTVDLQVSNRKVDLVQEHFDLAIRIGGAGGLRDSSLKARKLCVQKLIFVATPGYVERYGAPQSLADIARHRTVKPVSGTWGQVTEIVHDGRTETISLPDSFVVNSPNAARNAVLTGEAMGLLADYLVADMIGAERLVNLLPDHASAEQPIYAVFVHRNYMPAKVRAFTDYLAEGLVKGPGG